ncbi:MAG: NAD(P)H-dependent flavin oxidoreductase [Solirubrobacteraceae bacterium]
MSAVALPFPALRHPIVQAPMAGGPSTPALTAAVCAAGGLGVVAAGYRTADQVGEDVAAVRSLTDAPFAVNLFHADAATVDQASLTAYERELAVEATRRGVALGEPRHDDDSLEQKLELLLRVRPAAVSFTFGCPDAALVDRLHAHGIAAWATVTERAEARTAAGAGVDALILQGVEAGGHRGAFVDVDGRGEVGLLALLRLVAADSDLPLIASGGIADGAGVAAVLAGGARAAQIGSAFMRTPEAGTSAPQRAALTEERQTALTRAFSGRRARGIVNAFMRAHDRTAPSAYPQVHHLTGPLRAAARAQGDAEGFNLWAGQAYRLAEERPAGDLVRRWSEEARAALAAAQQRLGSSGPVPGDP